MYDLIFVVATVAFFGRLPMSSRSTQVAPRVWVPSSSTSMRVCTVVATAGSAIIAMVIGSCSGPSGMPSNALYVEQKNSSSS